MAADAEMQVDCICSRELSDLVGKDVPTKSIITSSVLGHWRAGISGKRECLGQSLTHIPLEEKVKM